jgi:hypothetical protein
MKRTCFRCGREITACMGFGLARDWLSGRRPIREHCGWCVEWLEAHGQTEAYLRSFE